jgi:hypothetical protein
MLAPALVSGTSAAAGVPTVLTPNAFNWVSSPEPVITPQQAEGHDLVSVKDPSVVWYGGKWHVFFTMYDATTGWTMAYKSFRNWSQADSAPQYMLDKSAVGPATAQPPGRLYRTAEAVVPRLPDRWRRLLFHHPDPLARPASKTVPPTVVVQPDVRLPPPLPHGCVPIGSDAGRGRDPAGAGPSPPTAEAIQRGCVAAAFARSAQSVP